MRIRSIRATCVLDINVRSFKPLSEVLMCSVSVVYLASMVLPSGPGVVKVRRDSILLLFGYECDTTVG